MKDFLGNKLSVGDEVVYIWSASSTYSFVKSKIVRLTDKMAHFEDGKRRNGNKIIKIYPSDINEILKQTLLLNDSCYIHCKYACKENEELTCKKKCHNYSEFSVDYNKTRKEYNM